MSCIIDYSSYLDKVYGCFLGKAVVGTMGAPFEGVKMPMRNPFRREMMDALLPNDDLDLQILWLDEVEEKGPWFSSEDLLRRFCEKCSYSPGEYAVMRRNWEKAILPPLSGSFGNDNFVEGMGCPIRSEIWACLAPGDADQAAEYAGRDGCLDHYGASVDAERFFAALEAEAFLESDLNCLITKARRFLPEGSRLEQVLEDTLEMCDRYEDIQTVFRKLHITYGHPDCTNLYQNFGITLASLLKGDLDFVRTGMMALNCGFDTDCTCATAGAVIGVIRGAHDLIRSYDLGDAKYVLKVDAKPRSDRIEDLAKEIAKLGCAFSELSPSEAKIVGALPSEYRFTKCFAPEITISYEHGDPSLNYGETKHITFTFLNRTSRTEKFSVCVKAPEGFVCSLGADRVCLRPGIPEEIEFTAEFPDINRVLLEKNIFELCLDGISGKFSKRFGLSGCTIWKVTGPYWRTEPALLPDGLIGKKSYHELFGPFRDEADLCDRIRFFHLNTFADTKTVSVSWEELFGPVRDDEQYDEHLFAMKEDSLRMEELCGMSGSCWIYLSRTIWAPQDMELFIQLGRSAPVTLWLNGKVLTEKHDTEWWTNENVHLTNVRLHRGENQLALRLTRVNADCKLSLVFSYGSNCSQYCTELGSVHPGSK